MQPLLNLSTGLPELFGIFRFLCIPSVLFQSGMKKGWPPLTRRRWGSMAEPALFFSIHIEPDFLLPIWDGDVALR
jgi:hypothetical protein